MTKSARHDFEITFDAVGGDQYHATVTVASEWDSEGITHDVTVKGIKDDHGRATYGVTGEQYTAIVEGAEAAMEAHLTAQAEADEESPYDTREERAEVYGEE